ncbi:MAG: hypothetical protein NWE89_05645 [Candidatus Bathyarchaeota archaeon]|nr:hypothetical protein [Candidatus Bathyarchaeota archaeon]
MNAIPHLAYLDAGIWISYGLGKNDLFYKDSKNLLENRLGKEGLIGIVSILSILESIDAIRRRVTEKEDKDYLDKAYNDDFRRTIIQTQTDAIDKQLAGFLIAQERLTKLIFADFSRVDLNEVINRTYDFEKKYFGIIRKYHRCGKCRRDFENYSYKGLGFIDAMHLHLAQEFHCKKFITTDQYYNHVSNNTEYNHLEFEIFRP